MKTLNDIVNWIINSGFLALLIYIAVAFGNPWIDSKIKHAKTAQSKELWSFIEQVANTAVNSLVSKNLTGDAKFAQATAIVQDALAKQGFTNVDVKSIESAVQSAYEKSSLTPTTNPEEKTDKSGQKETVLVPDGKAKAIDPKEVA